MVFARPLRTSGEPPANDDGASGCRPYARRPSGRIPRYPPFAKGFPGASASSLLLDQKNLLAMTEDTLGFAQDDHQRLVVPVLRRFAGFVHLLPASQSHHHGAAGGLLRHSLEVAFLAARQSESVIFGFAGASPRETRENEAKWRLAVWLAGLLHDVGKPLRDIVVTDAQGARFWNPYVETIVEAMRRDGIERYFIRWRASRHKAHERFGLAVAARLAGRQTLDYLGSRDTGIIEALYEAISQACENDHVIAKIVSWADRESVARDLRAVRPDEPTTEGAVAVERHVMNAMRHLVATGRWTVNRPGAVVWVLRKGVFIDWNRIGALYDLVDRDRIPGIPRDRDVLADLLIERGLAVSCPGEGDTQCRYWTIDDDIREHLPASVVGSSLMLRHKCLRLKSRDLVFTNEPPAPLGPGDAGDPRAKVDREEETGKRIRPGTLRPGADENGPPEPPLSSICEPETEHETPVRFTQASPPGRDSSAHAGMALDKSARADPDPDIVASLADGQSGAFLETALQRQELPWTGSPSPPDPDDAPDHAASRPDLAHHIASYGPQAARLLEKAAEAFFSGKADEDGPVVADGRVVIPHPQGTRRLGEVGHVVSVLARAGAVVPVRDRPGMSAHDLGDGKVLILERSLSEALIAARTLKTGQGRKEMADIPDPSKRKPKTLRSETSRPRTGRKGLP